MTLAKKITTAAALVAALLAGTAPKAAAQCPYTVGPLGRYIAPAIVQGMTATDDGAAFPRIRGGDPPCGERRAHH